MSANQSTEYQDQKSFEGHRTQFNDMLRTSEGNSNNFKESARNYLNNLTQAANDKSNNMDVEDYRNDKK